MGLSDHLKRANRKPYRQLMIEVCGVAPVDARPHLSLDAAERQRARRFVAEAGARAGVPLVGVNTGGGSRWQHKKWTEAGYRALLNLLACRRPDVEVILLGGPDERELNRRLLAAAAPAIRDGGCDHSLREFAAIVDRLDVLVTPDSLASHMATALETQVVVLVGPTSPWELEVFEVETCSTATWTAWPAIARPATSR